MQLFHIWVDNLTMEETVSAVERYIRHRKPLHLMGVNADKINAMETDKRLETIVKGCGIVNADGISLVWASRKLCKALKERVAGIDLMQELLKLAEARGYSVYLLGARQEVVEKTAEMIRENHPKLHIAGYRNGYFGEKDWPQIRDQLRESRANMVFVGITSPLKEYLIDYLQGQGLDCVFMGVGGSFDVLSGLIPRAPKWMQRVGLEWMFRVMQEPGRLWKRYLIGNTKFILRVYREKFTKG